MSTTITERQIDHINDLHASIKRSARIALKAAIEIGEFFLKAQDKFTAGSKTDNWTGWIEKNFRSIGYSNVYRYMRVAKNKHLFCDSHNNSLSIGEACKLIQQANREQKNRQKHQLAPVADPGSFEYLQQRLDNYVYHLWAARSAEAEIHESIRLLELDSEQVAKGLEWATRNHQEVRAEVLSIFKERRVLALPHQS